MTTPRVVDPLDKIEDGHSRFRLAVGSRLGPYEIRAPIGAGGMGEVYRARDSKLDRGVAIKVLPESVAKDVDALARFEREAKAAAAVSQRRAAQRSLRAQPHGSAISS